MAGSIYPFLNSVRRKEAPSFKHLQEPDYLKKIAWANLGMKIKRWRSEDNSAELRARIVTNEVGTSTEELGLVRRMPGILYGVKIFTAVAQYKANEVGANHHIELFVLPKNPVSLHGFSYVPGNKGYEWGISTSVEPDSIYKNLPRKRFEVLAIAILTAYNIWRIEDLPDQINVEATINSFMAQLTRKDFTNPKLIPAI